MYTYNNAVFTISKMKWGPFLFSNLLGWEVYVSPVTDRCKNYHRVTWIGGVRSMTGSLWWRLKQTESSEVEVSPHIQLVLSEVSPDIVRSITRYWLCSLWLTLAGQWPPRPGYFAQTISMFVFAEIQIYIKERPDSTCAKDYLSKRTVPNTQSPCTALLTVRKNGRLDKNSFTLIFKEMGKQMF